MNVRKGQDARSLAFLTDIGLGVYVRRDVCNLVKKGKEIRKHENSNWREYECSEMDRMPGA